MFISPFLIASTDIKSICVFYHINVGKNIGKKKGSNRLFPLYFVAKELKLCSGKKKGNNRLFPLLFCS